MKAMENSPERQEIIDRMTGHPAPRCTLGIRLPSQGLQPAPRLADQSQAFKVGHNTLKYQRVDAALRARHRAEWNRPVVWPLLLVALAIAGAIWPAWRGYRRRETATAR
jgi:oligopeptide transport system substrate-binding protein